MSAWGGAAAATKTPAASWDDDDGENGLDFPGLGDPPPSAALKPTSTQPQQPKTTQTTGGGGGGGGKKKKGTKLSLAEFSGISSSVAAPMDHGGDGFYRGPGGGGGGGMDAYALPTAPNRDRREEEEHGGRRAGELGGAFREYGGDRGIGGGGRDRDEDRYDSRRGERYDRRGNRGDRYGDRENRYGDREGDRYDRRDNYRGRRDDDRDFDEDGRERRREPEPSRADTGDWSKRTALPEREERRGGFRDRDGPDRRYDDRGDREPRGPSRADTGDWSKRTSLREDDRYEPVRERPRLNLQKRSEDADKKAEVSAGSSSLFGNAKPVDVKYVEDAPRAPIPERRKSGEYERRERREPRKEEELREATAEELANRPKLQLKKRETPVGESTSESRSSLFGGARPREEALKASGKDWLEEDKRIEEAKLAEKKRVVAELGETKKDSGTSRGGGGNARQISKEEQELKDKIALLKKENEGDAATDERTAEIDELYEDLRKLRLNARPSRKDSKPASSDGKKHAAEKKVANVPDADGFISVDAPSKKTTSGEKKVHDQAASKQPGDATDAKTKAKNVFDILGDDE